jgi:membrane-bound lytic murein transglycosylase D
MTSTLSHCICRFTLLSCALLASYASAQAPAAPNASVTDAGSLDVSKTPKEVDRIPNAPGSAAAQTAPVQPTNLPAPQPQETAVLIDNSTPITATVGFAQPQAHADMWARIRAGFRMNDLNDPYVVNQEQFYGSKPQYIARMTERSAKYLYYIVEELERRQMPTELALLPFIESAFNPQAVSSAKAAGMWQFIPSTGKFFDLKQNTFRDDRRDVLQSTRAALDYLQKLYGMFGDWHLALAAYNWGEGSVARAIKKNQATGVGTSYSDLNMPNETRYYVPKLQAMKNIVADPYRFNAQLPPIANHPYFQTVSLSRDMDVQLAARLAEMKVDDFRALNPSANKPVMLASGTPQILLPWDNADIFVRNLQSHRGQSASWTAWRVPSTMKVAEAAKRFGMQESQFRSINNIPPRMLIKAGSTLLVPRGSSERNQDVSAQVADAAQISLAPEIVLRKTTLRARKGDTVASFAKRYKISAAQVAQWNKVSSAAAFKPKQSVVIYLPVKAKISAKGKSKASVKVRANSRQVGKAVAKTKRGGKKAAAPAKKRR